jgi:hypothetical protein
MRRQTRSQKMTPGLVVDSLKDLIKIVADCRQDGKQIFSMDEIRTSYTRFPQAGQMKSGGRSIYTGTSVQLTYFTSTELRQWR